MSDDVLGKQFRAFIEGIFSYTPQVSSRTTTSRSQYNGSVIENVFNQVEEQIKDQFTKSLANIKRIQKETLDAQQNTVNYYKRKLNETPKWDLKNVSNFEKNFREQEQILNQMKEDMLKKYQERELELQRKLDEDLRKNKEKEEEALFQYKVNLWRKADTTEKAHILERRQEELRSAMELYEKKIELGAEVSDKETEEYKKQAEEKKDIDARYLAVQMGAARSESRSTRYQRYTSEVERIRKEQRSQELINRRINANDPEARRARSQEITQQTRESIRTAQQIYGFTTAGSRVNRAAEITGNVASVIATGPSGIVNTIEGLLGKASPVVSALMSIMKIVSGINKVVGEGVQKAITAQTQYMGSINARLQSVSGDTENYYEKMIDWSSDTTSDLGLAIGNWNAFVSKTDYVAKLNELVQSGIAYNAEERALIATLSDRMVTTFDALDASLTRLIRIQQRDMTYAALGSEALLTEFLNSQFKDTSYLNNMYDSVSAILLDATAKMSADQASAFQYEVQKWLGSLYSVGLSESGVQQLAQGLTYLATGDVNQLTSNQQLQYIYAAAAERGGMSLANILTEGLDSSSTNELLKNVVSLLSNIYSTSGPNTVQSAWSGITGMSISDLRSIQNIDNYMASISQSHATWADSLRETETQLALIQDNSRTSTANRIENFANNVLFSLGESVIESTYDSFFARQLGIEGESQYLGYYLGQQIGGSLGSLVSAISAFGPVYEALSEGIGEFRQSKGSSFFRRTGTDLTSILAGVSQDLIIPTSNTSSSSATSTSYNLQNINQSLLEYEQYRAAAASGSMTAEQFENFTSAIEAVTPAIDTGLPDLVRQAEAATQTASVVANESSEDRALLEEAADVQDYLFENEQTIRVTLALVEERAANSLIDALGIEARNEDLAAIKSTVQSKVNVDLIDSDVNLLLNSINSTKWSI